MQHATLPVLKEPQPFSGLLYVWPKRIAAICGLLLRWIVRWRYVICIKSRSLFGSQLDFQVAAQHLGSEHMSSGLRSVSPNSQHDFAARRQFLNGAERDAAIGNRGRAAFGLFWFDALREKCDRIHIFGGAAPRLRI